MRCVCAHTRGSYPARCHAVGEVSPPTRHPIFFCYSRGSRRAWSSSSVQQHSTGGYPWSPSLRDRAVRHGARSPVYRTGDAPPTASPIPTGVRVSNERRFSPPPTPSPSPVHRTTKLQNACVHWDSTPTASPASRESNAPTNFPPLSQQRRIGQPSRIWDTVNMSTLAYPTLT